MPPHSYDGVVSASEVGGLTPSPAPPTSRPWRVSSRWLDDSDAFNEWADEEDYEMLDVVRSVDVRNVDVRVWM